VDSYRTVEIAHLRIHNERAIGRVFQFAVMRQRWRLSKNMEHVEFTWQVCCYLTNWMWGPLIKSAGDELDILLDALEQEHSD